mmetsp:Transcript_9621/g.21274  ORF Transcript_9621/g.21274 Transcript_9621/m.21274 type:complete len:244 (+) Transcript_9621:815-1546(+)
MGKKDNLRHFVRRRVHKERAQPTRRAHLGLLEKKSDWKLRARNHEEKKEQKLKLAEAARNRNPDEFNFKMIKRQTNDRGRVELIDGHAQEEQEALLLAESQGAQYVEMRKRADDEKAKKLASSLHMLDAPAEGRHTVFVDSDADSDAVEQFDVADYFDTDKQLLGRRSNRLTRAQLASRDFDEADVDEVVSSYNELNDRKERSEKLAAVKAELDLRKDLKRGVPVKSVVDGKTSYTWKQQRLK